nr:MAG TPA: hypothetical protein [Caudoviricetes sp.]
MRLNNWETSPSKIQRLANYYCDSSNIGESFSFKLVIRGMKGENYIIFIILLYFS